MASPNHQKSHSLYRACQISGFCMEEQEQAYSQASTRFQAERHVERIQTLLKRFQIEPVFGRRLKFRNQRKLLWERELASISESSEKWLQTLPGDGGRGIC